MIRRIVSALLGVEPPYLPGGGAVAVPNCANATRQMWDVLGAEPCAADPQFELFGTRHDLVAAYPFVRRWMLNVRVYGSAACLPTDRQEWRQWGALPPNFGWFKVRDAAGVEQVRTRSTVVAGDRPLEWAPIIMWAGRQDLETETEDE